MSRFAKIQNVVEHELLEAKRYALAEGISLIGHKGVLSAPKATDISFSINFSIKIKQLLVNANKDSDVFSITYVI